MDTYSEEVVPATNSITTLSEGVVTPLNYQTMYVSRSRNDGPVTSTLTSALYYYSSGSYRQFESVLGTSWAESSSGESYLDNEIAHVSSTGSWPTTKVHVSGQATIVVETTSSTSGEFSISFLQQAGFSFGGSIEGTYFGRKSINLSFTYDLYNP